MIKSYFSVLLYNYKHPNQVLLQASNLKPNIMRFLEIYITRLLLVLTAPSAIHAHSWVEKVVSIYGEGMSRIGMDERSDVSWPLNVEC